MKRVVGAAIAIATITGISACTSSSGTHTQSLTPTPPSTTQTTPSGPPPTDPTTSTDTTTSRTHTVSRPNTIAPPSVAPAAQGAVNSYIAFVNLSILSDANPAHANLDAFSKYVTGSALNEIKSGFRQLAKDGYAYRGTPPKPRLKVTVSQAAVVVLSDCGLESTTHPYVEYDVKTGKAIPQRTLSPPPPYLHVITMHSIGGSWKLASIDVDSSKTCTP